MPEELNKLYIIILDGMSGEYLDQVDESGEFLMPFVRGFAKTGARFTSCAAVLPTVTTVNHTSIVTGAYPGTTGVYSVGNYYLGLIDEPAKDESGARLRDAREDPQPDCYRLDVREFHPRHVRVDTLLDVYKKHGKKTGIVAGKGWVARTISGGADTLVIGSYSVPTPEEGADAENMDPDPSMEFESKKPDWWTVPEGWTMGGPVGPEDQQFPPRFHVLDWDERMDDDKPLSDLHKTGQSLLTMLTDDEWSLPNYHSKTLPSNEWVKEMSLRLIAEDDPDMMYVIFAATDGAGHLTGSLTDRGDTNALSNRDAIEDEVRRADGFVEELVGKIRKRNPEAIVVITSDHGMSNLRTRDSLSAEIQKQARRKARPFADVIQGGIELAATGLVSTTLPDLLSDIKESPPAQREKKVKLLEAMLEGMKEYNDAYPEYTHESVDVRTILADRGFRMRAHSELGDDDDYEYEWFFAEGPNGYLYNAKDEETLQGIIDALREWNIAHGSRIWEIVCPRLQMEGINRRTGVPFNLRPKDLPEDKKIGDVVWPDLFLFVDRNHCFTLTDDALRAGLFASGVSLKVPEGWNFNLPNIPGHHGTYTEQHVGLIIAGGGIQPDQEIHKLVGTVDIAPTVLELIGLDQEAEMPAIDGRSLLRHLE